MIADRLKKREIMIPFVINEVLEGKRISNIKIWLFKEVATLKEG